MTVLLLSVFSFLGGATLHARKVVDSGAWPFQDCGGACVQSVCTRSCRPEGFKFIKYYLTMPVWISRRVNTQFYDET